MTLKQKEEFSRESGSARTTPRRSKTKSDLFGDEPKIKKSPMETRAMSHERENPHVTRSHGKALDITLEEPHPTKSRTPRGKAGSATVSPKGSTPKGRKRRETAMQVEKP